MDGKNGRGIQGRQVPENVIRPSDNRGSMLARQNAIGERVQNGTKVIARTMGGQICNKKDLAINSVDQRT